MSSIRFILRDLRVTRFWNIWSRNINVSNVVRRCRRDRSVRVVIQCVRQTFLRSRKPILLASAVAAIDAEDDDDGDEDEGDEGNPPCQKNITDEDLQKLLTDLDTIQDLIKNTLYCKKCHERIVIEKKISNIKYCTCKEPGVPEQSPELWTPYMEAEDVIIWRKEYKPGQGLFAYKVYGCYKEVLAEHFAAIQVDGGYRRIWDSAVAALSIVERSANGVLDQAVLHWEVLWPRLFANRDYVYIRRHKEFDLSAQVVHSTVPTTDQNPAPTGQNPAPTCQNTVATCQNTAATGQNPAPTGQNSTKTYQNPALSGQNPAPTEQKPVSTGQTPAKTYENPALTGQIPATTEIITKGHYTLTEKSTPRQHKKPIEKLHERPSVHSNAKRKSDELYKEEKGDDKGNRAFVIVSRSCVHPEVPESKHVIRVTEYWSHMVIKTLNGADLPGMEFVLTYYDEPAVGGMPAGVTSWATGRAAPAFLMNMRKAANSYKDYSSRRRDKDPPDFTPFRPDKVSYEEEAKIWYRERVSEEEMESSKQGPELENGDPVEVTREQSTQTEEEVEKGIATNTNYSTRESPKKPDDKGDSETIEDDEQNTSWWRHLYPFYYFL